MDYKECKFYIKYGRCSHKTAPEPYHSQCLGKEQCIVWNDPITSQALDSNSPILNAAQEIYQALSQLMIAIEHWQDAIISEDKQAALLAERDIRIAYDSAKPALAKAEGRE
jgi:hypothetical protein